MTGVGRSVGDVVDAKERDCSLVRRRQSLAVESDVLGQCDRIEEESRPECVLDPQAASESDRGKYAEGRTAGLEIFINKQPDSMAVWSSGFACEMSAPMRKPLTPKSFDAL